MVTMKLILERVLAGEKLQREETKDILLGITRDEYPAEQISALLTAIQMRGITVDELLGFRDGILETGVSALLDSDRYIDVVGTGGDRKNTFNISTTSCFVIAGAGYKVAKHGNYSATSTSGASNVIEQHGVKFTADLDRLVLCGSGNKFLGKSLVQAKVGRREDALIGVGGNLKVARKRNLVISVNTVDYGIIGAYATEHLAIKLHLFKRGNSKQLTFGL